MRMSIMENAGYRTDDISVEKIAANVGQIIDMSEAVNFGIGARAEAQLSEAG
jgi:hypothetical protein